MSVVEEVCTIIAEGQTTVPKTVRQALGVGYGRRIAFRMTRPRVTVHALPDEGDADPTLTPFLALLEADLATRLAEAVFSLPEELTAEVGEVNPNVAIGGEVSL